MVQSLGWEDPLEEMTTHSNTLAWRIPWTEEPGGQQSTGFQRVKHDLATENACIEDLLFEQPSNIKRYLLTVITTLYVKLPSTVFIWKYVPFD